jgi:hypothetical protein
LPSGWVASLQTLIARKLPRTKNFEGLAIDSPIEFWWLREKQAQLATVRAIVASAATFGNWREPDKP